LPIRCRSKVTRRGKCIAPTTPSGAIHVPHDPLRCSLPRGHDNRLLELGHRTDRSSEVHSKVTEQLAVVRVARLYQP
jgi:hypothetical protein